MNSREVYKVTGIMQYEYRVGYNPDRIAVKYMLVLSLHKKNTVGLVS